MTFFGVLYLGLPLGMLSIRGSCLRVNGSIFFLLLVTWASDTGAYYIGTLYGATSLWLPSDQSQENCRGLGRWLNWCHNRRVCGSLVVSP